MLGEIALVVVLLSALVSAQLALSRASYLFHRRFLLDEIVVHALVSDRDVTHSLRAIAGGLDTNPPSYHLLLRALGLVVGNTSEITLRRFAVFSVLAALLGLYVSLREQYSFLIALTAVLAVWSHPLVVKYAFEARMYGAWLAAVVWFAYFLARAGTPSPGVWPPIFLALTAVLACTLHTLGFLAFGLVLTSYFLSHPVSSSSLLAVAPASIGPLALLAWTPFMRRQNAAYPTTWVSAPRNWALSFLHSMLPTPDFAVVLIIAGLAPFLPAFAWDIGKPERAPYEAMRLAGLASLVLMPVVLTLLSFVVQPLLVDRYAFPAVASLGPAVASVVAPIPGAWILVIGALLFLIGARNLRLSADGHWQRDRRITALVDAVRAHTSERPVLFESLHDLYVVCRYEPDLLRRCFGLDFQPEQIGHVDAFRIASRDMMRLFVKFYPEPNLMPWERARQLPILYIVPSAEALEQGFAASKTRYPGFDARHLEGGLYRLIPDKAGILD